MTIQGAIGNYLRGRSAITTLIGQSLWPVRVPDGTAAPYAYYRCAAVTPDKSLTGPDLRRSFSLVVVCVSSSYDNAWAIAEAIIASLDYFAETMYGSNSPVDWIEDVKILFETGDDEDAPEFGLFEVSLQFSVSYPV